MTISIKVSEKLIQKACEEAGVLRSTVYCYPHENAQPERTLIFSHVPRLMLEKLATLPDLAPKAKVLIDNFLLPPEKVLGQKVKDLHQVAALLLAADGRGDIVGATAGKLTFPVTIDEVGYRDDFFGTRVSMNVSYMYGDISMSCYRSIFENHLKSSTGDDLTLGEVLQNAHFKTYTPEEYAEHKKRVTETLQLQTEKSGKLVRVTGPVYVPPRFGSLPVEIQIGKGLKKAIVEDELELSEAMWYNNTEERSEVIPLVRIFLLEKKAYCYVPVTSISEHKFDEDGFKKVVLPEKTRTLFEKIFLPTADATFGDIFGGRHGGTVVLADGPPGVGKTLTAEAVAELSHRPLYVADVGEIGIDLDTVEDKLKLVLDRASKWNAVLLLDEADIFLVKRDVDNIERNAIVGTFLKFLDGFDGTLFLTTNRVGVIDPAFASRITARVHYPALDNDARLQIWKRMVAGAKLKMRSEKDLSVLADRKMNGRQIRNVVRLAKMFYGEKEISSAEFDGLFDHVLQVEESWEVPTSTTGSK